MPLERYVQIDIDDIFVGSEGTRMNTDDVMVTAVCLIVFKYVLKGY